MPDAKKPVTPAKPAVQNNSAIAKTPAVPAAKTVETPAPVVKAVATPAAPIAAKAAETPSPPPIKPAAPAAPEAVKAPVAASEVKAIKKVVAPSKPQVAPKAAPVPAAKRAQKPKTPAVSPVVATTSEVVDDIDSDILNPATAVTQAAAAYVDGLGSLVRTAYAIGQEIVQETVEHGRTSAQAGSVINLLSLQAGYAQHRLGATTVHAKELADVASECASNVYAPLTSLLTKSSKA